MTGGLDASTDSVNAKIGTGLNFNGSSDYISTVFPTYTDWIRGTTAAWVYPTVASPGAEEFIISASINPDRIYMMRGTNGNLFVRFNNGSQIDTGTNIAEDSWNHVSMTWDSGNYKAFVNGAEIASGTYTNLTGNSGCPSIGAYMSGCGGGGDAGHFTGTIDDARLYDRALSAAEISAIAAACEEGNMIYNADHHVPQYCAGGDTWTAMGPVRDGIDSGLVAHWKLDETSGTTATEEINGNNGTMQNGMTGAANSVPGVIGTALDMSDASTLHYVNLGSSADIANIFDGGGTISMWYYARSDGDADEGALFYKTTNYGTMPEGYVLGHNIDDDGTLVFTHNTGGSGNRHTWRTNVLPLNEWVHVVVTYDSSTTGDAATDRPQIYFNGVDAYDTDHFDIGSDGAASSDASVDLTIGRWEDTDGIVDDFRMYNRIISPAEVMALYELGDGRTDPSLVGHWKLDDLSGTTAVDSSTGGNDGTLVNFDSPPALTSSTPTNAGLVFDGDNDEIQITDDASLDLGQKVTMAAWIYVTAFPGTGDAGLHQIFGDETGATAVMRLSGQRLAFMMEDGGFNNATDTATDLSQDQWHHVAVVTDGTNANFYIDGTLSSQVPFTVTPTNASADWWIGGTSFSGRNFEGRIDDVRVYTRDLSATEVDALYKMGIGHCTNPVGKEGDLLYNDDTGVDALTYCDGANWQMIGKSN